jgi:ubiquinone/menaquinone biosynthesis C-methylase UbiE
MTKRAYERWKHIRHTLTQLRYHKPIRRVLDLGCGNGEITEYLATKFNQALVYGMDVLEVPSNMGGSSAIYAQIDGSSIPLEDDSIDLVICCMSIHHFSEFDKMMSEIKRVLRFGGYLFIREHNVENDEEAQYIIDLHKKFESEDAHNHLQSGDDKQNDHCSYVEKLFSREELEEALKMWLFGVMVKSDYSMKAYNPQKVYHTLFISR